MSVLCIFLWSSFFYYFIFKRRQWEARGIVDSLCHHWHITGRQLLFVTSFQPVFHLHEWLCKILRSSSALRHVSQINTDDKLLMNVAFHWLWSHPPATLKASVYIMPFNIYLHPFKINKYFELAGDEVLFALYGFLISKPLILTETKEKFLKEMKWTWSILRRKQRLKRVCVCARACVRAHVGTCVHAHVCVGLWLTLFAT